MRNADYFIQDLVLSPCIFTLFQLSGSPSSLSEEHKDNFRSRSSEFLKSAVTETSNNAIFNIKIPGYISPGNAAATLAGEMLQRWEELTGKDSFSVLKESIDKSFLDIIEKTGTTAGQRNKNCTKFFNLRFDKELISNWQMWVERDDGACNTIYQNVLDRLFHHSLKWRTATLFPPKETNDLDLKLSTAEEQTLRYVAGYIAFAMGKFYAKKKGTVVGKAVLQLLDTWKQRKDNGSETTFLDYTNKWVERVNRGGLYVVNDEFYIFIRKVENEARTILNRKLIIHYRGEDLREVLMKAFQKSEGIDISWCSVARCIEDEEIRSLLKHQVLEKWISIRARSFLKCWTQMVRRKNEKQVSAKSEPALRKTLHSAKKV